MSMEVSFEKSCLELTNDNMITDNIYIILYINVLVHNNVHIR